MMAIGDEWNFLFIDEMVRARLNPRALRGILERKHPKTRQWRFTGWPSVHAVFDQRFQKSHLSALHALDQQSVRRQAGFGLRVGDEVTRKIAGANLNDDISGSHFQTAEQGCRIGRFMSRQTITTKNKPRGGIRIQASGDHQGFFRGELKERDVAACGRAVCGIRLGWQAFSKTCLVHQRHAGQILRQQSRILGGAPALCPTLQLARESDQAAIAGRRRQGV